jgi:hypothetical protein
MERHEMAKRLGFDIKLIPTVDDSHEVQDYLVKCELLIMEKLTKNLNGLMEALNEHTTQ